MTGSAPGDPPSWTIVIPTFNRPEMLRRAIESCVSQTVPCEIIVIDDHSTCAVDKIANGYPGLRYIRNPRNLGHSASVNVGVEQARGTWIKHLDDDDFLHPDCLRTMSRAIISAQRGGHNPKIVTCVTTNVDLQERPLGNTRTLPVDRPAVMKQPDLLPMMMCDQAPLGTPVQVAHERKAALDTGGWNAARPIEFRNGDEAECWIRVASQGDAIFLPDALSYRTLWSGNEAPPHIAQLNISRYVKQKILEQIDAQHEDRLPTEIVRYLNLHWGLVALKNRKPLTALKLLLGGMFDPRACGYIRRRSRFADAMKVVYLLK